MVAAGMTLAEYGRAVFDLVACCLIFSLFWAFAGLMGWLVETIDRWKARRREEQEDREEQDFWGRQ